MNINQESKKNLNLNFPNCFGPKNDKMCKVRPKCFRKNWPWLPQGQLFLEWPSSKGFTTHKNWHPLYYFSIFFMWYMAGTQWISWGKWKIKSGHFFFKIPKHSNVTNLGLCYISIFPNTLSFFMEVIMSFRN